MKSLPIRLPEEIIRKLDEIATETGATRSQVARSAIIEFLEDWELEKIAVERADEDTITLEELVKRVGV